MNYYPEFAALLDRYLLNADRSGAWLAQRLGINPATITRWRNGETRPNSPEMVVRLADVLGLHESVLRQQFLYAAGYGYVTHKEDTDPMIIPSEADKISSNIFDPFVPQAAISDALEDRSLDEVKQVLHDGVEIFGETLSSILGSRNIPQQRLAERIGVSPSAVSQWRTGTRIPDAATLYNIGSALELKPPEISLLLSTWAVTKTVASLLDYLAAGGNVVNLEAIKDTLQKLQIRELIKVT